MTIAIHQPNFFPYVGYFEKMQQCDLFVIMGHCQFEKNGYQNRFHVGEKWHTMSVKSNIRKIIDKEYVNPHKDFGYIKKAYPSKKLWRFDLCLSKSVFATNVNIINGIRQVLDIKTKLEFDYPTELTGTDRLIDICKHFGATKYLSGLSGKNYLELPKFQEHGIEVIFQENITAKPIIDYL